VKIGSFCMRRLRHAYENSFTCGPLKEPYGKMEVVFFAGATSYGPHVTYRAPHTKKIISVVVMVVYIESFKKQVQMHLEQVQ
jgi:hypothetical protein